MHEIWASYFRCCAVRPWCSMLDCMLWLNHSWCIAWLLEGRGCARVGFDGSSSADFASSCGCWHCFVVWGVRQARSVQNANRRDLIHTKYLDLIAGLKKKKCQIGISYTKSNDFSFFKHIIYSLSKWWSNGTIFTRKTFEFTLGLKHCGSSMNMQFNRL